MSVYIEDTSSSIYGLNAITVVAKSEEEIGHEGLIQFQHSVNLLYTNNNLSSEFLGGSSKLLHIWKPKTCMTEIDNEINFLPSFHLIISLTTEQPQRLEIKLITYQGNVVQSEFLTGCYFSAQESELIKMVALNQIKLCQGVPGATAAEKVSSELVLMDMISDRLTVRSRTCSYSITAKSAKMCGECFKMFSNQANNKKAVMDGDYFDELMADFPIGNDELDESDPDWSKKKRLKQKNKKFNSNLKKEKNKCAKCAKTFQYVYSYQKHIKRCNVDEISQPKVNVKEECPVCLSKFTRNGRRLHRHIKKHHEKFNLEINVACPLCSSVNKKLNLNEHFANEHPDKGSCCAECLKVLPSNELRLHFSKAHDYVTKKHLCQECGEKFRFPGDLRLHVVTAHDRESEKSRVMCDQCGRSFPHRKRLVAHIRVSHNKNQAFSCHLCDKVFYQRYKLVKHLNIHTGLKPFKCKHCSYRAVRKDNVMLHIRRVHKMPNVVSEDVESSIMDQTLPVGGEIGQDSLL